MSAEILPELAELINREYDLADPMDEGYRPDGGTLATVILSRFKVAEQAAALAQVLDWCDTNQHPFHPSEGAEGFSSQDWALDDAARRIRTIITPAL